MGPLFSLAATALIGVVIFATILCVSAVVWRRASFVSLAVFAAIEAATFLFGFGVAVFAQFLIWGTAELTSRSAVHAYFGICVAAGGLAAALAGRAYWKLMGAR